MDGAYVTFILVELHLCWNSGIISSRKIPKLCSDINRSLLCLHNVHYSAFSVYCFISSQVCFLSLDTPQEYCLTLLLIYHDLWSGAFISLHFYFWDLLRESYKQYEILLIVLFLGFLIFLASEALLFISFFWASFHSLSSPSLGIFGVEGFYVPDPCQLTFANTLLLSNAAVSLGGAFVSLEISISFLIFFSLFSFILAWMFISLQIKEFINTLV